MKKISEIMNSLKNKISEMKLSEIKLSEIKLTAQQKKIAACGVAAVLVVIAAIIGVTGRSSKKNENDASAATATNDPSIILSTDGTGLQKNADEKVNELINNYLTACKDGNIEALEKLVSDGDDLTKEQVQKPYEYVENIENVDCYTLNGPGNGDDEKSYIVYVYSELKFKDIATDAPGLRQLYVSTTSDGSYAIMLSDLDETVEAASKEALNREDVKSLIKYVDTKYKEALNKDENLKNFIDKMNETAQQKAAQQKEAQTEAPEQTQEAQQ